MLLFSLTYVSCAEHLLSKMHLAELLEVSRRNNARDQITGMLLYKEGNFMQVLEGEESAVRHLHDRIARDSRHHGLITLLQNAQLSRSFADWSMGFRDLESTAAKPEGYSEFLNSPLTGAEFVPNPSRAQKLLLLFKKTM